MNDRQAACPLSLAIVSRTRSWQPLPASFTTWSNTAMAARYQHITAAIRRDVAQRRVGGLLWETAEES